MESFKDLYDITASRYIAEMTWDSGLTLYEKKWFDEYIYMDFESLKVKVPAGYDAPAMSLWRLHETSAKRRTSSASRV